MQTARHVFRFPGTLAGFEATADAVRDLLDRWPLDRATRYDIELAFEEIVANIVRHGAPTEDVEMVVCLGDAEVVLTFEHDGIAFDPRGHPSPVAPVSLEDAQIGGLGLLLVGKLAKRMDYEYAAGRNRLTVAVAIR